MLTIRCYDQFTSSGAEAYSHVNRNIYGAVAQMARAMAKKSGKHRGGCGNFDIILDQIPRPFQLHAIPARAIAIA